MNEFSQSDVQSAGPRSRTWNTMSYPPPQFPMIMPHNISFQPNLAERATVPLEYLDENHYNANYIHQESMFQDDSQSEIQEKANNPVEAIVDQNLAYSQFINFMKEVGGGEINLEIPGDTATRSTSKTYSDQDEQLEKMEASYKDEWARLSDVKEHPWLSQFGQKENPFTEYNFSQENNMSENANALEIGKQKLKLGDVPGAVLCFEACVKQNPNLVEGWLLLGTTQAENEQDPQAIAALSKCVTIDPTCLPAYMALGASYTNENYPNLAYQAFNNWLKANPQCSDLVPVDINITHIIVL